MGRSRLIPPSYHQGYARSAGESELPDLWRGLVGLWVPALGITGGRLLDLSPNQEHATLIDMDIGTDWVIGGNPRMPGRALDFDGTDDRVAIRSASTLVSFTEFTIEGWTKVVNLTDATMLYAEASNVDDDPIISVSHVDSGGTTLYEVIRRDNVAVGLVTSTDITGRVIANTWHHFVFVNESNTTFTSYVDGVQVASGSYSAPGVITFTTHNIGARVRSGGGFHVGQIGKCTTWSRALNAAEVLQLYTDPLAILRRRPRVLGKPPDAAIGRIMSSLVGAGGLVGKGGIAGEGGGLAG